MKKSIISMEILDAFRLRRRRARAEVESGDPGVRLPMFHGLESSLDGIDKLQWALRPLLREGLPVTLELLDEAFLGLCSDADLGSRVTACAMVDNRIRSALIDFDDDVLAEAARILFGHASGTKGRTLTDRRQRAAATLTGYKGRPMDAESFRRGAEERIITKLAWQLFRKGVGESS